MPSQSYVRFIESLQITYEQWHDGIGYDIEALAGLEEDDRPAVEEVLLKHLADHPDWRDVEALQALGTTRALDAVRAAAEHPKSEVRAAALREALNAGDETGSSIEDSLVRGLQQVRSLTDLIPLLQLAPQCPTLRVKQTLLDQARTGGADIRVHAAAMLMFLCGQAKEPFDWDLRPFFLQFKTDQAPELQACWEQLRSRTGL
jgi:hypothetical protein